MLSVGGVILLKVHPFGEGIKQEFSDFVLSPVMAPVVGLTKK